MGRITKFYEAYQKELGFLVVLLLITAVLVGGTLYHEPPQLKASLVMFWAFIFCIDIVSLEARAQSHDELFRAAWLTRFCIVVLYLMLFMAYLYLALVIEPFLLLLILGAGTITVIIAEFRFERRKRWLSFIKDLRENHPYEYLRYLITSDEELTEEQQLQMLHVADAKKLVCQYIRHHYLCTAAELELLNMPYAMEVLGLYFSLYNFDLATQLKMFKMPNAEKLIEMYINGGCEFDIEAQIELLNFTSMRHLLEMYVDRHRLSPQPELMLFDLPSAGFIKRYAEQYPLSDEARARAKDMGYL